MSLRFDEELYEGCFDGLQWSIEVHKSSRPSKKLGRDWQREKKTVDQ